MPEAVPAPSEFDVLVCAGDVWEGEPEAGLQALTALAQGRPVVLAPGNHEHYRRGPEDPRTLADLLRQLDAGADRINRKAGLARVHVLRDGSAANIGGVRFVGATLWSDWSLAGRWIDNRLGVAGYGVSAERACAQAIEQLSDPATGSREYRGAIWTEDGAPWTPHDAIAAHERDRAALTEALRQDRAGPVVVVTHHPPIAAIADAYRDVAGVPWWVPAFYCSAALDNLPLEVRPELWVSGHFHAAHDVVCGATRCVANPVDGGTFDPTLVVSVA